jgi:hypothetical protein
VRDRAPGPLSCEDPGDAINALIELQIIELTRAVTPSSIRHFSVHHDFDKSEIALGKVAPRQLIDNHQPTSRAADIGAGF